MHLFLIPPKKKVKIQRHEWSAYFPVQSNIDSNIDFEETSGIVETLNGELERLQAYDRLSPEGEEGSQPHSGNISTNTAHRDNPMHYALYAPCPHFFFCPRVPMWRDSRISARKG